MLLNEINDVFFFIIISYVPHCNILHVLKGSAQEKIVPASDLLLLSLSLSL